MQILCGLRLLPSLRALQFDEAALHWSSGDETVKLVSDSDVRIKVLQVKSLDGFCLGSIKDDFLGLIAKTAE